MTKMYSEDGISNTPGVPSGRDQRARDLCHRGAFPSMGRPQSLRRLHDVRFPTLAGEPSVRRHRYRPAEMLADIGRDIRTSTSS